MANEALMALSALQQQTQQGQAAAQPQPLIQQSVQPQAAQQVALPGDVARSQGLISGFNARKRLSSQQDINNQQLQQQFENQQLAAEQDAKIFAHDFRQEEIATQMAEMELQKAQTGAPERTTVIDTAVKLGAARDKQLKPMTDSLQAYDSMAALDVQGLSPANATALVFKFVQSMDNTAVRDGERQMITGQGGPMAELVNKWNLISGGGAIAQEAWDDMIGTATTLAKSQFETATEINNNWDKRISAYAKEFMMPALLNTTQSTSFDPNQQFRSSGGAPRGTGQAVPVVEGLDTDRFEVIQ